MKAGSLWPGSEYAYFADRGRGNPLPLNARRVRVLDIKKVKIYGKTRERTYVEVQYLTDDGEPDERYSIREVVARDIIDFWSEYDEQRKPLVAERDEANRRWEEDERERKRVREERWAIEAIGGFIRGSTVKQHRMEHERVEREAREKRQAHLKRIHNVLITRGLTQHYVTDSQVTIPLSDVERWLGIESAKS